MHTLIRPSLYGAWHEIQNLSADGTEPQKREYRRTHLRVWRVRWGMIALYQNLHLAIGYSSTFTGAYGRVMSSQYNRRHLADEWFVSLDGQSVTKSKGP